MIDFKCYSKTLLSILKECAGLIPSKPIYQVLGSFLIRVGNEHVEITAGDNESVMTYRITDFEVSGEGAFCVEAKKLIDIMKSVPTGVVEFCTEGKELTVSYPNGKFKMAVVDANEYPISAITEAPIFREEFETSDVVKGFDHSLFAVSSDTLRPVMTAICVDVSHDAIAFAASDTHILSYYKILSEKARTWTGRLLIGSKAASTLSSLMLLGKTVEISSYSNALEFSVGPVRLRTKIVKGNYPDYLRVFPHDYRFTGSVGLDSFSSAVKRVSLTSPENYLLECEFAMGSLSISAQNPSLYSSATERISCTWEDRDNLRIGLNAERLKTVLSSVRSSSIRVQANTPDKPIVLIPVEDDRNVEWKVLIMPMQLL